MTKYDILKYYEIALIDVENIIGVNSTSIFRIDKICMRIVPNYLGTFHQIMYQDEKWYMLCSLYRF